MVNEFDDVYYEELTDDVYKRKLDNTLLVEGYEKFVDVKNNQIIPIFKLYDSPLGLNLKRFRNRNGKVDVLLTKNIQESYVVISTNGLTIAIPIHSHYGGLIGVTANGKVGVTDLETLPQSTKRTKARVPILNISTRDIFALRAGLLLYKDIESKYEK